MYPFPHSSMYNKYTIKYISHSRIAISLHKTLLVMPQRMFSPNSSLASHHHHCMNAISPLLSIPAIFHRFACRQIFLSPQGASNFCIVPFHIQPQFFVFSRTSTPYLGFTQKHRKEDDKLWRRFEIDIYL